MQISSFWGETKKKKKMKGCISTAQMFSNKLLPGSKSWPIETLWGSLKACALLLCSQNTFPTNNSGVHTYQTCYKVCVRGCLCTVLWSLIRRCTAIIKKRYKGNEKWQAPQVAKNVSPRKKRKSWFSRQSAGSTFKVHQSFALHNFVIDNLVCK